MINFTDLTVNVEISNKSLMISSKQEIGRTHVRT
jgi:hypothetical protein